MLPIWYKRFGEVLHVFKKDYMIEKMKKYKNSWGSDIEEFSKKYILYLNSIAHNNFISRHDFCKTFFEFLFYSHPLRFYMLITEPKQ